MGGVRYFGQSSPKNLFCHLFLLEHLLENVQHAFIMRVSKRMGKNHQKYRLLFRTNILTLLKNPFSGVHPQSKVIHVVMMFQVL